MCIMSYWLSTNHELYPSVSNTALLLVMPVRWSPRVPLEKGLADICTIAHGVLIYLWLLVECFFFILWVANVCLLLNGLEQISQTIAQLSWTQKNMLIQIIFRSNRFTTFTRMTAFLVNCKLLSRKICRWCDVITLGTRLISGLMFFSGGVCWWGRVKYWFDGSAEMSLVDGWNPETLLTITGMSQSKFCLLMVAAAL